MFNNHKKNKMQTIVKKKTLKNNKKEKRQKNNWKTIKMMQLFNNPHPNNPISNSMFNSSSHKQFQIKEKKVNNLNKMVKNKNNQ